MKTCKKHDLNFETKRCPKCKKEETNRYNAKYPGRRAAVCLSWARKNPDKIKKYGQKQIATGQNAKKCRSWKARNKHKVAAYAEANKEVLYLSRALLSILDPEAGRKASKKWKLNNKEKCRNYYRRRALLKRVLKANQNFAARIQGDPCAQIA